MSESDEDAPSTTITLTPFIISIIITINLDARLQVLLDADITKTKENTNNIIHFIINLQICTKMKKAKMFHLYFINDTPSYKEIGTYHTSVVALNLADAIKACGARIEDVYSVSSDDVFIAESI